jgi:hypothetical protein
MSLPSPLHSRRSWLARFGIRALHTARGLAKSLFRGPRAVRRAFSAFHAAARQIGVGDVWACIGHNWTRRRLAHSTRWRAEDLRCARLASAFIGRRCPLGGEMEEIAASESAAWRGEIAERPFGLLAQTSLFDPSLAPAGKHTLWTYCHMPNGSAHSMTERIENQIERFAPGFRARMLAATSWRRPNSNGATPIW